MFCQNCGTKNNDESIFCEECGTKLEKPVSNPVKPSIPRKPISKLTIAIGAEAVLLAAMIVVFFSIGNKVCSPEKVVEKYFVELANQDLKGAYKLLDVEEDDFINEKLFEKVNSNSKLNKVTNYEVKKSKGGSLGKNIEIEYRTKGSSSDESYYVSVNKKAGKKALFFDNWEVTTEAIIVKDFLVTVPAGAKVTVDGVELDKSYINQKDEAYQFYTIPAMFAGEHQIVVSQEDMQEVRKIVSTNDTYSFWQEDMVPQKEVLEEVIQTAAKDFEAVYMAAASGKEFDSVKDLFSSKKESQSQAKEEYEELRDELRDSSYSFINKIAFSEIEGTIEKGYAETDEMCLEVSLEFDYLVDYDYEDWFGEVSNKTYNGSDYIQFKLIKEDGAWKLMGLSGTYLYY